MALAPRPAVAEQILPVGEEVEGYQIEKVLAETPGSVVFNASLLEKDIPVAFKVARDNHQEGIWHEIGMHSRFSGRDPSILDLVDFGEWRGRPFLVTPLQAKGTLQAEIHRTTSATSSTEGLGLALEEIEKDLADVATQAYASLDGEEVSSLLSDVRPIALQELQGVEHASEALGLVAEVAEEKGRTIDPDGLLVKVVGKQLLEAAQEILPKQNVIDREHTINHINILRGVLDALKVLHTDRGGVVHRDLKAGNIFITDQQAGILGDFGSATFPGIRSPKAVGTIGHMSPEACSGVVELASDIFSFSTVAYHALTGRLPWPSGRSIREYRDNVCSMRPIPINQLNSWIPEETGAMLMAGLSLDYEMRPSVSQMQEATGV